jgi:S-formylglutathione hydrolase
MKFVVLVVSLGLVLTTPPALAQSRIVEASLETDLVPSPVEYAVLLPDGYREDGDPLPLLINLHGGQRDRSQLTQSQPLFDLVWADGTLPPVVVAMPSAGLSFYLNYQDRSERWEEFILEEFLPHLRDTYRVHTNREGTLLTGASMGGVGSLRLAFKHPERFAAVAALEPAIDPVLTWDEVRPKHQFFLTPADIERFYGSPVDKEHWAANNPASIANAEPAKLRDSGLQVYFEAGDLDFLWLYEGAEFLHQVLWTAKIPHEYHLVRGADHIGATLGRRILEALRFLGRELVPQPHDPVAQALRDEFEPVKQGLSEGDHYGLDGRR